MHSDEEDDDDNDHTSVESGLTNFRTISPNQLRDLLSSNICLPSTNKYRVQTESVSSPSTSSHHSSCASYTETNIPYHSQFNSASNSPKNSPLNSPIHSPLYSSIHSVHQSPVDYTKQYNLKDFSIPLKDVSKKLNLYQSFPTRRGRPRGRPRGGRVLSYIPPPNDRITYRGRPRGRPRGTLRGRGRPRGRPRGTSRGRFQSNYINSDEDSSSSPIQRDNMFDNVNIPIEESGRKIPKTVCRHLISHCTKKHPRNQDLLSYSPYLVISNA